MTLARRKLEELYRAADEFDVSPQGDGSFMIRVRKLGPTEQTKAARESNSARTKFNLQAKDESSAYYATIVEQVNGIDLDDKITQLAMTEIADDREKLEQEISGYEEWSKDGYLQSLVDAWESGLFQEWSKGEGERSEESERVFSEMKRFTEEVDGRLQKLLDREKANFEALEPEEIDQKMIAAQTAFDASAEWLKTFRMHQILYGARDVETNEPIFESLEEIAGIPAELFAKLVDAVIKLNVPITEVKY